MLELAWRILVHQKGRTSLATAGIFIAILLIFIELGFFIAVPQGGMLIYDHMRFDLLMVSDKYVYQSESGQFPRARLVAASRHADVVQAAPVYIGGGKWQDPGAALRLDFAVIGIDPQTGVFAVPDIESATATLQQPDTILVDAGTRPLFGPLTAGREIDVDGHRVTIGGTYTLGTGFLGMGVAVASEANFYRIFPRRSANSINLGLVTLRPGSDPDRVARELRATLPGDTRVLTRAKLTAHEVAFWTVRTSTGLIFGSGLVVSFIVGIMVLYQTLATQITRQLPQFATLKAVGYGSGFLNGVVLFEGLLITIAAFVPALVAALAAYWVIRAQTRLPVALSVPELGGVFTICLAMAVGSALLSVGGLRRADPADLF